MPSRTSAAAALRLAGVIRFNVPSSSSAPHRPQFDSDFIIASMSALLTFGFAFASESSAAIGADIKGNKEVTMPSRMYLRCGMDLHLSLLLGPPHLTFSNEQFLAPGRAANHHTHDELIH